MKKYVLVRYQNNELMYTNAGKLKKKMEYYTCYYLL